MTDSPSNDLTGTEQNTAGRIGLEELAETSAQVASTRSRKQKKQILGNTLRGLATDELALGVTFLAGDLPMGKLGLGGAAVRKALAELQGSAENPTFVSLHEVADVLSQIQQQSGTGSTRRKHDLLVNLCRRTSAAARLFLAQLIVGELRQGALESILVEAVSDAMNVPLNAMRRAVMFTGDIGTVTQVAQQTGEKGLQEFGLELFRPVQPMLAEPMDDMSAAMGRLGEAALEYKLDGVRVQVHKQGEQVRVFTRHLKEVTANVPEIVELVRELPVPSAILDGETLALRSDGRPQPFQTTMKRFGRTREIQTMRESLPLSVLFFDALMVGEQDLIDQSTHERHEALADAVSSNLIVPRLVTNSEHLANDFLAAAVNAGHEGVMAKSLESVYAAGGRGQSWLKIKPSVTLDLVVLAAEWGSGRRRGHLSNLHLGARDNASGQFAMIGKTFKGLTDEMLSWQTAELLKREVSRDEHTVHVRPELVVEIAFNEVQQSSHYASGYALRFARVKRYREDKTPDVADTIETVAALFAAHRR